MNISNGLKSIVNVAFWIWIILGVILVTLGALGTWTSGHILIGLIFGIGVPVVIRYVILILDIDIQLR